MEEQRLYKCTKCGYQYSAPAFYRGPLDEPICPECGTSAIHRADPGPQVPSAIKRLDARIKQLKERIGILQNDLDLLETRRKRLLELPDLCPTCNGSGLERFTSAAGDSDLRECMTCKGLGKVGPIVCKSCKRTIGTDMIAVRRDLSPQCPWCGVYLPD